MKLVFGVLFATAAASTAALVGLVGLVAVVAGGVIADANVVGSYALPLPVELVSEATLAAPHHDYAAWDAAVPVGTPIYAITNGTVATASTTGVYPADPNRCGTTIATAGDDGAHYVYCHLSRIDVRAGDLVVAGQQIGLSGGTPGAPGAGNTTGPHLHLGIRVDGVTVCPQPLLLSIHRGAPISPTDAPTSGCSSPGSELDWPTWLDQNHPRSIGSTE